MIENFNSYWGGAATGFIISQFLNIFEIAVLLKVAKDIRTMMLEFKKEGKREKYLE